MNEYKKLIILSFCFQVSYHHQIDICFKTLIKRTEDLTLFFGIINEGERAGSKKKIPLKNDF